MKITLILAPSAYPQVTAQTLKVGQCVRYPAGNFVVRVNVCSFLEVDGDKVMASKDASTCGHGYGDLMPQGTELYIKL